MNAVNSDTLYKMFFAYCIVGKYAISNAALVYESNWIIHLKHWFIHEQNRFDCLCERVIESLTQPIRSKHWFTQEVNVAAWSIFPQKCKLLLNINILLIELVCKKQFHIRRHAINVTFSQFITPEDDLICVHKYYKNVRGFRCHRFKIFQFTETVCYSPWHCKLVIVFQFV